MHVATSRKALVLAAALVGSLFATAPKETAAAPALRYQVDLRGDLLLFGNTVGHDCRQGAPKPVVGTPGDCGPLNEGSNIHVLWRSDDPMAGAARADRNVTPEMARSTAVLTLPTSAKVAYARLYFAAGLTAGPAGNKVLIERQGQPPQTINADLSATLMNEGPGLLYQGSADITQLVQSWGSGAYRVSQIAAANPVGLPLGRRTFVGWSVVVLFSGGDTPRTFTLSDGLERVDDRTPLSAVFKDFVPPPGTFEGKLGVIAYDGDEIRGDTVLINDKPVADSQNPADNFFNGTRSTLGQRAGASGDLPQLTGEPRSLSGMDLDLVDITAVLDKGKTSATVSARTSQDIFYWGAFATAVSTYKPILESDLTYINLSNPGGPARPGDRLEFILTTRNVGNDVGSATSGKVPLPMGITYVPGSLNVTRGANLGKKTDAVGDDQAEFDPVTRQVQVRLGSGAGPMNGGTLGPGELSQIRWQATVDMGVKDQDVKIQGTVTATPVAGMKDGVPAATWPTGDGTYPNRPSLVPVRECLMNSDCPLDKPICDVSGASPKCTNSCKRKEDCAMAATGKSCLPTMTCGCTSDADCISQKCDVVRSVCVLPEADLALKVRLEPNPPVANMPVTHVLQVENKGPGTASPGTIVTYTVPEGGMITSIMAGPGWQCVQMDRTVTCTYSGALPPGNAPEIRITITPPPMASDLIVSAKVYAPATLDKDLTNNVVATSVPISAERIQLSGGGFGCGIGGLSSSGTASASAALGSFVFVFLGFLRRRRSKNQGVL